MEILVYRTIIMLAVVLLALRLMGKRQFAQLEISELVVAVMISDLAVEPIIDSEKNLLHGIIPVLMLLFCELFMSVLSLHSVRMRVLFSGKPSILVKSGQINQKEMHKNRLTIDELFEGLRSLNVTDISTLKYAILETDGTVNAILAVEDKPLTVSKVNTAPVEHGMPVIVINDGKILDDNLKLLGLDIAWLNKQLKHFNVKSPKGVYLLTVDEAGGIFFARRGTGV